jgi:septal ring factor EnvC (AmiA/AmiB activator)
MKIWIFITVFFSIGAFNVNAQTRSELEEQRKKAMDEINYVDNILKTTEKEKTESLQSLRVLNIKLNFRESVLKG